MSDSTENTGADAPSLGQRGPEAGVAALLMVIGIAVIVDSLRVGTGWADDGPRSGYFPFYIGILLTATSGFTLLAQLWHWRRSHGVFAELGQLRMVVAVFVPMVIYTGFIPWLGIYLASVLLIAYFMKRHGRYGWPTTAGVSVGVMLVLFLVFERWFVVPLPKGPIEQWLGL